MQKLGSFVQNAAGTLDVGELVKVRSLLRDEFKAKNIKEYK